MKLRYEANKREVLYLDDCERVQTALRGVGIDRTLLQIERIWQAYSNESCAGWLHLPENDEDILSVLVEDE